MLEGVGRAFYLDLTKVWCSLHKRASQAHIVHCTLDPHKTVRKHPYIVQTDTMTTRIIVQRLNKQEAAEKRRHQ